MTPRRPLCPGCPPGISIKPGGHPSAPRWHQPTRAIPLRHRRATQYVPSGEQQTHTRPRFLDERRTDHAHQCPGGWRPAQAGRLGGGGLAWRFRQWSPPATAAFGELGGGASQGTRSQSGPVTTRRLWPCRGRDRSDPPWGCPPAFGTANVAGPSTSCGALRGGTMAGMATPT